MTMHWGILGPGGIESVRRVRTLGLAASVRNFNELAVPGLGGVWFAKQVFLATLGVLVAERATARGRRVTRIGVANAIEALACWQSLGTAARDGRVRGSDKLAGKTVADFRFDNASRPHFYVTQPMRMACVAALPSLGLVDAAGSRFNAFTCTPDGLGFVEAACEPYLVHRVGVVEYLVRWVMGEADSINTDAMRAALSPLTPLPTKARDLLRERLQQTGGAAGSRDNRRRDALQWVQSRRRGAPEASWHQMPVEISDPAHWDDMLAGARFFATQAAASALLENVEREMPTKKHRFPISSSWSPRVLASLAALRLKARMFLELGHDETDANAFSREMVAGDDKDVLRRLVGRDGRILRLVGDHIIAGPAFFGAEQLDEEETGEEAPIVADPNWPEDISYRIRNLWWLSLDIDGEMNDWLNPIAEEASHG